MSVSAHLARRRSWAACLRRVFEAWPLQCVECGTEMQLAAMITRDAEVVRILSYLGQTVEWPVMNPARPPPNAREEETQIDPNAERWDGIQDT